MKTKKFKQVDNTRDKLSKSTLKKIDKELKSWEDDSIGYRKVCIECSENDPRNMSSKDLIIIVLALTIGIFIAIIIALLK